MEHKLEKNLKNPSGFRKALPYIIWDLYIIFLVVSCIVVLFQWNNPYFKEQFKIYSKIIKAALKNK